MGSASTPGSAAGIPGVLAAACADVRAAGSADTIAGRAARFVAAPATAAEAGAILAAAGALGLAVVPRGSGSRTDKGAPPQRCDVIVETTRLDQITEHAPGDLVVRVQAGVKLEMLARALAAKGQRLPVDPPVHPARGAGTVGGLVATGQSGPLRFAYGTPRDLLIGITIARADGTIARSGGKVVKNVAGYDLGKLFAGSHGSLGLIIDATFRLHPLPATRRVWQYVCDGPAQAAALASQIAAGPLAASAIELYWPSAAAPVTVAVLLEGDEASVSSRSARLAELGDGGAAAAGNLPSVTTSAGTIVAVACWAVHLAEVLEVICRAASGCGIDPQIGGSAGAGVLQVAVAPEAPPHAVAGFVTALRAGLARLAIPGGPPTVASAVIQAAPADVMAAVDAWGPVPSLGLMRAVKDQFDPGHIMAPGLMPGGI